MSCCGSNFRSYCFICSNSTGRANFGPRSCIFIRVRKQTSIFWWIPICLNPYRWTNWPEFLDEVCRDLNAILRNIFTRRPVIGFVGKDSNTRIFCFATQAKTCRKWVWKLVTKVYHISSKPTSNSMASRQSKPFEQQAIMIQTTCAVTEYYCW